MKEQAHIEGGAGREASQEEQVGCAVLPSYADPQHQAVVVHDFDAPARKTNSDQNNKICILVCILFASKGYVMPSNCDGVKDAKGRVRGKCKSPVAN